MSTCFKCQSAELHCNGCGHDFTVDLAFRKMGWSAKIRRVHLDGEFLTCKECGSKELEPTLFFDDRRVAI